MKFTVNTDGPTILVTCSLELLHSFLENNGKAFEGPCWDENGNAWCWVCDRPSNDCGCVENGGNY